jgi:hypothetical protein
MSDKKTLVPVDCSPGSRPLKVSRHERYARYRAAALPRIEAFRKIGNEAALDKTAHNNATRLEKGPGVKERIAYLTKQAEERIAEKARSHRRTPLGDPRSKYPRSFRNLRAGKNQ